MKGKMTKFGLMAAAAAASWMGMADSAQARGSYPATIPTPFSCATCHFNPGGGGARNNFGNDYRANGRNWAGVCNLDSDMDGFTNGEEFGDPDCNWVQGDPRPMFDATRPGDADDSPGPPNPCGNGQIDEGEQCDGNNFDGETCETNGLVSGMLRCNDQCQIETDACLTCGNGAIDNNEACDGEELGGATCEGEGFVGGTIACDANCNLDTSNCEADPDNVCGDGAQGNMEECDGEDLAGASCESLEFDGGTLGCADDCTFDTSACEEAQNPCGNGVIEDGEDCDGDNLGAAMCGELVAGTEGTVACNDDCTFDTSGCMMPGDPNNAPNNDVNNDGNNAPNNDGNNEVNNDPGEPPVNGGDSDSDDGGCCATLHGQEGNPAQNSGALFALLLLGLVATLRRRK